VDKGTNVCAKASTSAKSIHVKGNVTIKLNTSEDTFGNFC
jgi:hypothetical protein